jgi:hypothetical protein
MSGPQGLKPAFFVALSGMAEAVPFPKPLMRPVPDKTKVNFPTLESKMDGKAGPAASEHFCTAMRKQLSECG